MKKLRNKGSLCWYCREDEFASRNRSKLWYLPICYLNEIGTCLIDAELEMEDGDFLFPMYEMVIDDYVDRDRFALWEETA